MKRHRAQSQRAFSLIELVIAIAIMLVLGLLLLSSVQKIRENARATQCINNLRAYGQVFAAYHNDNGQRCITPGYISGDNNALWNYVLNKGRYLDFNAQRTLYCPSLYQSTYIVAAQPESQRARDGYVNGLGYAYNAWLSKKRVPEIQSPSKTYLLTESFMDIRVLSGTSASQGYAYRHSDGRNILFLDGHVESWSGSIPYPPLSDTFWAYPPR